MSGDIGAPGDQESRPVWGQGGDKATVCLATQKGDSAL